jgi:ribosome-associated toxin RatA of RatAB toxin-antitoxin module
MPMFERSTIVRADAGPLFALMQDYDRRLEWDPFLRETRLVGATRAAVGVRAWCVDRRGRGMETEYVAFRPPRRVAVRMTRGPWFLRRVAGSWIYDRVEVGLTRVRFKYHVEARLPWPLVNRVVAAGFASEMTQRLRALRDAIDAGILERQADAP